jgi:Protein of unknown function (DUF2934)
MNARLVDVANKIGTILHTFPITTKSTEQSDDAHEAKALSAAGHAQLVPDSQLRQLTAKMHVCREGPLAPYGDERDISLETKLNLEQIVRERAYFLWQQEGCLDGRAEQNWSQAHDQQTRERAYVTWQQQGCPDGLADEHWRLTREFEQN